jgi:uncharacterized protein YkwD
VWHSAGVGRVGVSNARTIRLALGAAVLLATGLLAASALATGGSERSLPALNHQVFAAINKFRVAHGLVALSESSALDRSARQHSLEMGKRGYFGHSSADGTVFWRRIGRYYGSTTVGENLLWGSPSVSSARAMQLWIASPEHLRNLLTAKWRQIGVSAVSVAHAPGVFHGPRVTIITTDFGVRAAD